LEGKKKKLGRLIAPPLWDLRRLFLAEVRKRGEGKWLNMPSSVLLCSISIIFSCFETASLT
jgi:hypothetical protein